MYEYAAAIKFFLFVSDVAAVLDPPLLLYKKLINFMRSVFFWKFFEILGIWKYSLNGERLSETFWRYQKQWVYE